VRVSSELGERERRAGRTRTLEQADDTEETVDDELLVGTSRTVCSGCFEKKEEIQFRGKGSVPVFCSGLG
jgi:hypothetical protein